MKTILPAVGLAGLVVKAYAQNVNATWGANGNSAWYTGGNWAGGSYAGVQGAAASNANIATFSSAFTAMTVGINMGTASLNLGAVSIDNTRTTAIIIGNSSATPGVLRLYGATVNSVANVIVRNNGTGLLTLQAGTMGVVLNNITDNIINTDATGGVTIVSILSGSCPLTKGGSGMGVLTLLNTGNTYTGKTTINTGFINVADEAAFGTNPASYIASQVTLDGGGIQTNAGNISFNSNRGITINGTGGTFDVANTFIISLQKAVSGSGDLIKSGLGILQLNKTGGNTLPITNNLMVNDGTLQISTDQTLNNLSLVNGNLAVDNGVTLTINGIFDYFQPAGIMLIGTGKIVYGTSATLKYSGTTTKIATATEWPALSGPVNVDCNNSVGLILPTALTSRIITGSLVLTTGTFIIGAGVLLDLNGASLISSGGFISGTGINNSTTDLIVRGTTGGPVILPTPTNVNIGLRNVTVAGTRTLALNGTEDFALSGTLSVAGGATFDNGGESQVTGSGAPFININGTFITRDLQGFSGVNTSIPGIVPILNPGSTIEYGRAGSQSISIRTDYQNLRFTGGGIKTHFSASPITPINGTVTIPDATTLDIADNTFGSAGTSLTMTNGRFRLSGTGTKPEIDGTYNLTGNSVIEFYNSGTVGNETIKGKNGASADIHYNQIEVTGNKVGNSLPDITLNMNGIFTVKSGGIFEMGNRTITAAAATSGQSVIVENNGTFLCGNSKGFNGFSSTFTDNSSVHSNITNIVLGTGSTVNYTKAGDQQISNDNGIEYGNLILSGSGIKTAPAATLTVLGNLVKSGASAFEANGGTVLMNGGSQSFAGLAYNNLLLDNAGTKTLIGNADILDSIRIGNPGFNPVTILDLGNYDLTLKSTASKTAKVATLATAVTINYTGTGRFLVERFYKALRAWRMITLPLTSKGTAATSIFDTWQNGGVYEPGKGMFVTGPGASRPTPGADGLDWSDQNNYSFKRFANNNYSGIGKTKDSPVSGNLTDTSANIGYFAFVRGDRNRAPNNTIVPNTNVTTLTGRGKLQTGRQTFHVNIDSLNSFTLVGNPYPCPVDFNLVTKNNVYPNRFIAYDPTLNGVGVFVIMEDGGSGIFVPKNVPSTQNNFIQSGQAFFVQPGNIAAPADLVFNEYNKSVDSNNLNLFRPAGDLSRSFKTVLNKRDDIVTSLADGVNVQLDNNYNDGIDIEDALKFENVAENLAIMRDGTALAVEKRPVFKENDTLFYRLTRTTQRSYQMEFRVEGDIAAPGLAAWLEDSYTNIPVIVNLPGITTVNFNISSDAASAARDRFRVIFKLADGGPVSVRFTSIKAWRQGRNIAVEWTVENEMNTNKYEVEKCMDGVNFSKVNTTIATGENHSSTSYHWLDRNVVTGSNYYRIRTIDLNNKIGYSHIVKVNMPEVQAGISIYPNPVKDGIIGVEFKNMAAGIYNAKLVNNLGQTVLSKIITHLTGTTVEAIAPDHKLVSGIYQLRVMAPDKKITTVKVIVK
ncbi:MAG: hypothetical protein ABI707_16960 [Ferruginibacter sp.]